MVDIKLNLPKIAKITKFEFADMVKPIQLRVSFFDCALDTTSSPIVFSQEKLAPIHNAYNMVTEISATWDKASLPCLHTALNTPKLASQSRLLMFIWACGPTLNFPEHEMLLGQVNIQMKNLQEAGDVFYLMDTPKVCLSNIEVGEINMIKIKYDVVQ